MARAGALGPRLGQDGRGVRMGGLAGGRTAGAQAAALGPASQASVADGGSHGLGADLDDFDVQNSDIGGDNASSD